MFLPGRALRGALFVLLLIFASSSEMASLKLQKQEEIWKWQQEAFEHAERVNVI